MKRKMCVLAAICLTLSLGLQGCGDSGNSGNGAPVGDSVTLPVTGEVVPSSIFDKDFDFIYASVRSGGSDEVADVFEKLKEMPRCNPSMKYFAADELDVQMNLALTAGKESSPYDMFRISLRNYRDYTNKGLLLPMDDYIEKYEDQYHFSDIPESVWEPLKELTGEICGIPLTVNVQHLFYRGDIFEKNNLEPPKTIDELLEVCEKLKQSGDVKYPIALALDKGNGAATEFVNMMYGAGADFFDENVNPIFNGPEGVKCLEKLAKIAAYCPDGVTSMTNDDVMVLMQTGQIAMMNTWASRAVYMDDKTVSSVVGLVEYAPAPLVEEGKYPFANLSTDYMVIPANTKGSPEAKFLALAEMTSDAAQTSYMEKSFISRLSPTKNHPEILESQPNAKAVSDTVAAGAQVGKFHPGFGPSWSILSTYVAMALDGSMTPQDALNQAAAECTVVLKDSGIIK